MVTTQGVQRREVARPLTKKQRNDVYRWLETSGWDPARFEWGKAQVETNRDVVASLFYKADHNYLFAFDPYGAGDMTVDYRPGADEAVSEADEPYQGPPHRARSHWGGTARGTGSPRDLPQAPIGPSAEG